MFAHSDEHGEFMRGQAAEAKRRALRKLPDLLETAERNLKANGWGVEWAEDAAEANRLVLDIARRHGLKTAAKSKSMLSEELGVNHAMEAAGLRVVETDLGEYIIQLNNETPSHIVAPVMHKTKDEIRDIFVRELGMAPTDDAEAMVAFARKMLREDFLTAEMGISGGNFLIAETGSIGLVMNEGNGRMCTSLPRVHIALVGIEKLVETVEDYATLTQVLPRSSTGQPLTVYTNILNGPGRADEGDGPEHAYVILVDNGRSEIYGTDYAECPGLHPLRRLPECLPRLSQHGRPRLWLGLWRSDWRGLDAPDGRAGECQAPAACQQPLRQPASKSARLISTCRACCSTCAETWWRAENQKSAGTWR